MGTTLEHPGIKTLDYVNAENRGSWDINGEIDIM